jgi:hypothetical protein
MTNLDPIERMVLSYATEDDYGLWELADITNESPPELVHTEDRIEVVSRAIRRLVECGFIELKLRKLGPPAILQSGSRVSELLADRRYWLPPVGDELEVVVGSTAAGNAYYFSQRSGDRS